MTNKTQGNIPKGNDHTGSPPIYFSEYDLADEDIQVCIEALGLDEVLYQIGFDKEQWYPETETFYEILECKHKTRTGKIVEGKRYSSKERMDKAWLESGLASEEAKMLSRCDRSYLAEIRALSQRSR